VAASDVPEDRLDECLHELKQGVEPLRLIVQLAGLTTAQEVAEMITGAEWVDDDKKQGSFNATVVDEDGNELASANVRVKLD
jgi:hypothetical protein